jgi:hypothetical protein
MIPFAIPTEVPPPPVNVPYAPAAHVIEGLVMVIPAPTNPDTIPAGVPPGVITSCASALDPITIAVKNRMSFFMEFLLNQIERCN